MGSEGGRGLSLGEWGRCTPLRELEFLTIVVSIIWIRIAGAAAPPGLLSGGTPRWVGPGVCQPWVGSRAKAHGWPEGEQVNIGNGEPKDAGEGRKMAEIKSYRTETMIRGKNWERLNMERPGVEGTLSL